MGPAARASAEADAARALPLPVAVELASAWIQDLARARAVPVLFLKGPGAALQRLRTPRVSTDVDVLVRPGDLEAVLGMLRAVGWRLRPDDNRLGIFPEHSVTLLHPHWPCDLDVHFSYPGVEADPHEAFELLWASRESVELAHRRVDVPDPAGHAVVLALTALREPWVASHQHQLLVLARHLSADPERHALFRERAAGLGAEAALAPLLRQIDPTLAPEDLPRPSREWRLYTNSAQPATIRLAQLRDAPWPRKARMLADAVAPSRTALASQDLRVLDLDRRGVWRVRLQRLGRGLAALPAIVRDYRSYRHATAPERDRP